MFKNRKRLEKMMYVLAIIMVAAMLLITLGPSVFGQ